MRSVLVPMMYVVVAMLVLPGCAFHKANYLKNTPRIDGEHAMACTKDKVTVRTKIYDKYDSKEYFGTDLLSRGYTPIQISIDNQSNDAYVFQPSYMNVEMVSSDAVAQELYSQTGMKTVGLFATGYLGLLFFHPLWPLMVVAPYYGMASYRKNQKITERLPLNTIQEWQQDIVIPPHTCLNKFVFTPTETFHHAFSVGVFNQDQKRYDQFHFNDNERSFVLGHSVI